MMSVQKYIRYLLRKTLLKKGSSSNSFPKTFSMKFQPHRVHPYFYEHHVHLDMHPMGLKFVLKVFGRGYGGEPFLRKVSPDKYM